MASWGKCIYAEPLRAWTEGDGENVPSRGNYKRKSPEVRGSMAEVRNGKSYMAGLQGAGQAGGDER